MSETYEYRHEDMDPAMRLWLAWARDLYDEDRDAGLSMLCAEVARVLVRAGAPS